MDSIGLWLVKTQTIGSGVATVSVTNAFSSSYTNYLVQISTVYSVGAVRVFLQCNNSTGATYAGNWFFMDNSSGAVNGATAGSTGAFDIALSSSTGPTDIMVNVFNPFTAVAARMTTEFAGHTYVGAGGGRDTSTNSSTGFTLSVASGNMTGGTVRVYGYRD
jgi:hypothetical protein